MSFNKVILVGNLGRDAELKYTTAGVAVATLNMATSDRYKDKQTGETKENTEWHRVVVWDKQAEALAPFLVKGKRIVVEGKLMTRKWQDKDGVDKFTTEVKAAHITLLGGGDTAGAQEPETRTKPATQKPDMAPLTDDDIPF